MNRRLELLRLLPMCQLYRLLPRRTVRLRRPITVRITCQAYNYCDWSTSDWNSKFPYGYQSRIIRMAVIQIFLKQKGSAEFSGLFMISLSLNYQIALRRVL